MSIRYIFQQNRLFFQFGGSEAIITALSDEFPKIGRHREIFVACLFTLYFLVGLASCAQGGFYFFHLLDRYAAGYSMLFTVFFEAIAVSWIYGRYILTDFLFQILMMRYVWSCMLTEMLYHAFDVNEFKFDGLCEWKSLRARPSGNIIKISGGISISSEFGLFCFN